VISSSSPPAVVQYIDELPKFFRMRVGTELIHWPKIPSLEIEKATHTVIELKAASPKSFERRHCITNHDADVGIICASVDCC
jgi:hypothetical protein